MKEGVTMDRTTAYAELVVSGGRMVSRAEYLCCKRHLDDLKKSKSKNFKYFFDVDEAEKHIQIANLLVVGEGTKRKRLTTRGFQNFILGNIFGWKEKGADGKDPVRRYREAYVQMGRQNGKSFLCGVLCNDFATFSGYHYGRIMCTATKQKQANIVFDEVVKFIDSDKDLAELYERPRLYTHEIESKVTHSVIEAIGRDTKTADGFRSILAVVDEYHRHPTNQMYLLMRDGQVSVKNALTIAITTAGFNLNFPCYEQYKLAKNVVQGNLDFPELFVYIAEADIPDQREDPEGFKNALWNVDNWAKANPFLAWKNDTELNPDGLKIIKSESVAAKTKGGEDLRDFTTKRLDCWTITTPASFVDPEKWHEGETDYTLADMAGKDCYIGVDLSEGGDLTSVSFVFPLDGGNVFVDSHSFMPERRLEEHEQTDKAPYRQWVDDGLLTLTNGPGTYGIKTDYKFIISYLVECRERYGLNYIGCGYDNHNAAAFLPDLDEALGIDLTEVIQSFKSLSDATKDFQLSVKSGTVLHNPRNQLLTWAVVNAVLFMNPYREVKIDKYSRKERIDPCDALIDAWKLYYTKKPDESSLADDEGMLDAWLQMIKQKKGTP